MTRDEILNMPAGREMDALVAEKVMGEVRPTYHHDHPVFWQEKWSAGVSWYCLPEYDSGDVCEWKPNHFSTDIAAAWKVVQAMEQKESWFELSNVIPNSDPIVYEVKFSGQYSNAYACEDTAPLAICRAALLAVGGTE